LGPIQVSNGSFWICGTQDQCAGLRVKHTVAPEYRSQSNQVRLRNSLSESRDDIWISFHDIEHHLSSDLVRYLLHGAALTDESICIGIKEIEYVMILFDLDTLVYFFDLIDLGIDLFESVVDVPAGPAGQYPEYKEQQQSPEKSVYD